MGKSRVLGAFLIIVALLVMLIPAAEADAETSASAFRIKRGELVKYTGKDAVVTVPGTVTVIGKSAFENNTYVEKIILPDSVEQIKAYAFWGCDNLRTVTLGKGLASIGDFAFTNCTGLETMTLPETVHSIGIQAFSECKRFEDITIPPQVVEIREDSFDGDYLLNIHCEEGSYADKYAKLFYERQKKMSVYGNTNGIGSSGTETGDQIIKLPSTIPADGVYSGADVQPQTGDNSGQTGSGSVQDVPGTVVGSSHIVANQAFVFMQNSDMSVRNGNDGKEDSASYTAGDVANMAESEVHQGLIPERTHYRDETCTSVSFAENVKEIGQFAYARSGLQEARFSDGLERIDYAAFYHCDGLTEVVLPGTVTSVEAKAFAHTAWVDRFLAGQGPSESDFLISGGVLIAYRGSAQEVQVPDGVRVIAGEAFADHKEISRIELPASLQTINDRAFAGCHIMDIQYEGDVFSEDVLEESVQLQSLAVNSTGTETAGLTDGRGVPAVFVWCISAVCFLGGVFCIFKGKV